MIWFQVHCGKTLEKLQFVQFQFCIQDEHPQLSEKIIKKYYSYLCASFFTFTDYRQNNRFNADANLKIQWSSSERDRKDTWKKCKKLYASHHPVYSGKQLFTLNTWVINIILNKQTKIFKVFYLQYRRRQWHPTPVLLPGKSHGRRSLAGCSPWGH